MVYNVLVFPGGTEIGLEIHHALCHCKEINLVSAGMDVSNHAAFLFAKHYILPSIHEEGWLEALNRLIAAEKIDFVFPAYDDIIVALASNAAAIGATIVTSPLETCLVTRSKSATYRLFAGTVPLPRLYLDSGDVDEFPVFVKPDRGQGSQGTFLVHDKEELRACLSRQPDSIVIEYLPGEEYTVDCFSDRERGILFVGGRERVRTTSGISMNSRPVNCPEFETYARAIAEKLSLHGAWFYQVKRDRTGVLKLLEIAPRIAGTMALHRVMGLNFPLLSIFEQARIPVTILQNSFAVEVDRALVNRYCHDLEYNCVYVDFDDTLIVRGKVNTELVGFLFQCINGGKKIILVTRHAGDLDAVLRQHRLHGLFDEVVHITDGAGKYDFMCDKAAIFIDDSFSERKSVQKHCAIPTFDNSMLEVLLDNREFY